MTGCGRKIGPYDCCTVVCGDCLELMKALPDGSIDAVITDPPYGITDHEWDNQVDPAWMVAKSAICTASEPYATQLINSSQLVFRFDLVWIKNCVSNHFNAKRMPMRRHERILVFGQYQYHPQMRFRSALEMLRLNKEQRQKYPLSYPDSVLEFDSVNDRSGERTAHPSQKPVELLEYLIETFSTETILDPFLGSGTTAVAAKKLGRHFLGFEISPEYCRIAEERIALVEMQPNLFTPQPEQIKLL